MLIKGNFDTFFLSNILQLLCDSKKAGMLQVTRGKDTTRVFLKEGVIVYAASSQKRTRLEYLLINSGVITPDQLKECSSQEKTKKQTTYNILVEKGYLSQDKLKQFIRKQIENIIYDLLLWEKGNFEYKDLSLNLKGVDCTRLDPMKLILDAFFQIVGKIRVNTGIKLNADEWRILSKFDGKRTVRQVMDESGCDKYSAYKILNSFISLGLIKKKTVIEDKKYAEEALLRFKNIDSKTFRNELNKLGLPRSSIVRFALTRIFREPVTPDELLTTVAQEAKKILTLEERQSLTKLKEQVQISCLKNIIYLLWEKMDSNLMFLQQISFFQGLSKNEIKDIERKAVISHYKPNEIIVKKGEPGGDLYIIKKGIATITQLLPGSEKSHVLSYLIQGQTFGEISILEDQPQSASIISITDMEVLIFKRKYFLELLKTYPSISFELSRTMGQHLADTGRRLTRGTKKTNLILIVSPIIGAGSTSIAHYLSITLSKKTGMPTVYIEYPNPDKLPADFGFDENTNLYHHPVGYDILLTQEHGSGEKRADMILEQAMDNYNNIVIRLSNTTDTGIDEFFKYANQVIFISEPVDNIIQQIEDMRSNLKQYVRSDKITVFTVINHSKQAYEKIPLPDSIDFEIPFLQSFPPVFNLDNNIPEYIANMVESLVDRLERTHQIKVYIPTTIDIDKSIDTTPFIEKTMSFLGERFGGATSNQADGIWNSEEAGLVSETVYIINTYVTKADMEKHMDELVEYIEKMKITLKQDAMALEIDNRLILI
ncbi:hypothetical protein GMMP13_720018 [Candidatus Magnetomoraceae bacterium gMMP-13]